MLFLNFDVPPSLQDLSKRSSRVPKSAPRRSQDDQNGLWDGLYKSFRTNLERIQDTNLIWTTMFMQFQVNTSVSAQRVTITTTFQSFTVPSSQSQTCHISSFHKAQDMSHTSMWTSEYSVQRRATLHGTRFTLSPQVSKQRRATLLKRG